MFTEIIESIDSSLLIPSKEEIDSLIKKLENNEELSIEDRLILSKFIFILDIKKRGLIDEK